MKSEEKKRLKELPSDIRKRKKMTGENHVLLLTVNCVFIYHPCNALQAVGCLFGLSILARHFGSFRQLIFLMLLSAYMLG